VKSFYTFIVCLRPLLLLKDNRRKPITSLIKAILLLPLGAAPSGNTTSQKSQPISEVIMRSDIQRCKASCLVNFSTGLSNRAVAGS
jgi:hypothetical protein